jgi:hypothetical protein
VVSQFFCGKVGPNIRELKAKKVESSPVNTTRVYKALKWC